MAYTQLGLYGGPRFAWQVEEPPGETYIPERIVVDPRNLVARVSAVQPIPERYSSSPDLQPRHRSN